MLTSSSAETARGSEGAVAEGGGGGRGVQRVMLPQVARLLYGLASFVIIVAGMKAAADLLNLVFLSVLLALTVAPLMHLLMRRGAMGRGGATLVAILLVLIGGASICTLLGIS